jgi:hypothetical protein
MQHYYHLAKIDLDYVRRNPNSSDLDLVLHQVVDADGMPFFADAELYSSLITSRAELARIIGFDCNELWYLIDNELDAFHGIVVKKNSERTPNPDCYLIRMKFNEDFSVFHKVRPSGTECHW